ncbi:MAG: hypothetical protein KME29_02735 [Calothrix sp. FI2-JRJ7]|jgi:hypothetical protein|nr:hypothetical protein [Calothrix sp. FI2-JRJ7]
MDINAFVDCGFSPGRDFRVKFLESKEFTADILRGLISSGQRNLKKDEAASSLADALEKGNLTPDEVLLAYVKQPRTWLSIKTGSHSCTPTLNSPALLLSEFGEEGWYGPIQELNQPKQWYIRTYKIIDRLLAGNGGTSQINVQNIRWSVIAEVSENYVALSWDGFTFSPTTNEHVENTQFPFWQHIPVFFDELARICDGQWKHPNLQKIILHDMWDKYLNKPSYKWKHLRVRAEAAGLVINAHSAGVQDVNVKGLQALSQHIAKSVLNKLGLAGDTSKMVDTEDTILLTLIKEWGTKSYEFQLDEEVVSNETELEIETEANKLKKYKLKNLFKAHCYFGLKPNSKTPDCLEHLKCFMGYYGGSTGVLKFLLKELGL